MGLVLGAVAALIACAAALPRLVRRLDQGRAGGVDDLTGELRDLTTRTVTTRDGAELHVVQRGSGPTLLLVHGLGLSHELWRYQLLDLADRFRVVAVDLRGHAASTRGAVEIGPHAFADDLATVLTALDLRDVVLVGHSLGGTVVGQLCADHPGVVRERVAGLVFVGTFASALAGEGWWRERFSRTLMKAAVALAPRRDWDGRPRTGAYAYLSARGAFGNDPTPEHVHHTLTIGARTDPTFVRSVALANLDYDVREKLRALDVPALVLRGTRDRFSSARSTEQLQRALQRCEVVVVDGVGHLPMLERRQWFADVLIRFAHQVVGAA